MIVISFIKVGWSDLPQLGDKLPLCIFYKLTTSEPDAVMYIYTYGFG